MDWPRTTWRLAVLAAFLALGPALSRADTILRATLESPYRVAEVQTWLARRGFSGGLIDNRTGPRTRAALADFMVARGLAGEPAALAELAADRRPVFGVVAVSGQDVAELGRAPADWEEAARVPALAYETLSELLSDRHGVSERFLRELNPGLDGAMPGTEVMVPVARPVRLAGLVEWLEMDPAAFRLRGFMTNGVAVFSAPCSIARRREKVPEGDLTVVTLADNPDYTFNPANFPDNPRAREIGRSLILPPGPNNPVGVFWIGLSRPGFGIHGTPHPETVGTMESSGCFRLTNRDVRELSRHVRIGMTVRVKPREDPE